MDKIKVTTGLALSREVAETKPAIDAPNFGGVRLAAFIDPSTSATPYIVRVDYDDIPELLEVLVVALAEHRRREARAVESRALAEAAFPGIGALLMK